MLKFLKKAFSADPSPAEPQPQPQAAPQPSQPEETRLELTQKLDPAARQRLAAVEEKYERILQLTLQAGVGNAERESQREALDRMLLSYLKLLAGQDPEAPQKLARIEAQIDRVLENAGPQ